MTNQPSHVDNHRLKLLRAQYHSHINFFAFFMKSLFNSELLQHASQLFNQRLYSAVFRKTCRIWTFNREPCVLTLAECALSFTPLGSPLSEKEDK